MSVTHAAVFGFGQQRRHILQGTLGLIVLRAPGTKGPHAYSLAERLEQVAEYLLTPDHGFTQGLVLAVVGTLVGGVIALAVTRHLGSLLFGIRSRDPWTLAGVTLILVSVSMAACALPARRATRVDPMIALRQE